MTILERVKILIGADVDDETLAVIIALCQDEAKDYCNLTEYIEALDPAVIQMVVERYNKLGNEGLNTATSSTITSGFIDGYSKPVYSYLQKYRKIRMV